jgi:hypothetical protein
MNFCKGIVSALALLLAIVGLLLSLVVGVGVWVVKEPVTDRVTYVYGRVDAGLDLAEKKLDHAQASLTNAAERLESVKEDRRKLAQDPRPDNPIRRVIAGKIQRTVAPMLGVAHEDLHFVAEAAVVVNSVLDDLGSSPLLSVTGLDMDRLREMNSNLAKIGPAAWELSQLLGGAQPDTELSQIEQFLTTVREGVVDYQAQVRRVRQQATEVKTRTLYWITPAAILVSCVCLWIALSQICVMSRAWSWLRSSGGDRPRLS